MLIHLLDMGFSEYGDCIVIHNDQKRILVDGAHKWDSDSLRAQFRKIFDHSAPFHFDLLIMTHLHDDHIGCLPELIGSGTVTASKCILMDPVYRWGDAAMDSAPANRDAFVDALLEEDHSFLSDDELEAFILDSDAMRMRYTNMIRKLQENAEVILFKGSDADDFSALENEFKSLGLKILGPTANQLQITQDALLGAADAIADFVHSPAFVDSAPSLADRYRRFFSEGAVDSVIAMDAAKSKGSINNESIVLKFEADGWSALLAADMQFADPQVTGIEEEMEALLNKINEAGPYNFIKTSHHSSHNGLDEEMLDFWLEQGTEFFGHSGGLNDATHPHPDVLTILKDRKDRLKFARTDRNGLIRVGMDEDNELSMWLSKGTINNFARNKKVRREDRDDAEAIASEAKEQENASAAKQTLIVSPAADSSHIQFAANIPSDRAVRIIIEVDGEKKK